MVRSKYLTPFIYLAAAVAASFSWLIGQQPGHETAAFRLIFFLPPLLFAFAYPRFLYASSPTQPNRQRLVLGFHGLMATISSILFVIFGSVFWKNPLRGGDSSPIPLLSVLLIALPVLMVAAFSLLLRSTLATLASFFFWPYWLFVALSFISRFFEASLSRSPFCFLGLSTAIFLAFAAGAIAYRPITAHATALAALVGMPWLYWTTL